LVHPVRNLNGEQQGINLGDPLCPGSPIVHADDTVMACTEDEEPGGRQGRDLRHDGDAIRCWTWTLPGCH
jgi:hypothetical protein